MLGTSNTSKISFGLQLLVHRVGDSFRRCGAEIAIDKLCRDNPELEKTMQTLQELMQMTKGRTCFGPLDYDGALVAWHWG